MKINSLLLVFACSCFSVLPVMAQSDIYAANKSTVSFFSKAPLEDIEAINEKAVSLLNVQNNEIVVRIPIRQFEFRNKLMQQHFNENYMESEKFPYATFKGKINEAVNFSKTGVYSLSSSGVLNIHGVNRKRTLNGTLTITESGEMVLDTKFDVLLADHKISVPRLVFNKIAERIAVSTSFSYSLRVK